MAKLIGATSVRARARIAGVFYLIDLVTSVIGDTVLRGMPLGVAADRIATACYVVVTLLLVSLLGVVSWTLAVAMAFFSLFSLMIWTFGHLVWNGSAVGIGNTTFGVYCLLAGYLIYRSAFMPRAVGVAMALGGLGLLTYVSPRLVSYAYPYNVIPALIGEVSLMLWLLAIGVNSQRWQAKAETKRLIGQQTQPSA